MQQIIGNIDDITTSFKANTENLNKIMQNMSSFSDTLSQLSVSPVLANISKASNQILNILEKLNSNESTAGMLLNDDELYKQLNTLSGNLSSLINDIQTNPKRYLHFSALDLGKEVYINASGDAVGKNIVFKVHLISSETKIPENSKLFQGLGDVEEYNTSGVYTYLLGSTSSYNEIQNILDTAKQKFPDATIVAFKDGRLIKLEKALKSLRK